MDRVCCEVLKQMSDLIHPTTWTNKSSTLPSDDVSSVSECCDDMSRSGSVEIQRQAYDLLEKLLPKSQTNPSSFEMRVRCPNNHHVICVWFSRIDW